MENTQQIAQKVLRNLDDLNSNFYDLNNDVIPSIQDGYNLAAAFCETIESRVDVDLQGGVVIYDLSASIPDYLRIYGIYNNQTNRWLEPTSLMRLWQLRNDWELANGEPYYFWPIDYKHVALFPVPATTIGSINVMYKAKANTLTANTLPTLPDSHLLINYATGDLLTQCEEFSKAIMWATRTEEEIQDACRIVRERSSPNRLYYHRETF